MRLIMTGLNRRAARALTSKLSAFRRDEEGSMIVFTLFILVLMLIVGGMAVDFMRFEARRTKLQGVVDRAVLAAADLDQVQDSKAVVRDYFEKAGMLDQLKGEPIVTPGNNYREVTANGELKMNTFFLKLIGMNQLSASATSTAVEGIGDIEISLIIDISGSMGYSLVNDDGSTPTMTDPNTGVTRAVTRMDRLQQAATNFVSTLLTNDNKDKISISLIPYSEHVNIGPNIFNNINTTAVHNFSHCVEFPAAAYSTTVFDTSATYTQVQHLQTNSEYNSSGNRINDITEPVCPFYSFERVTPLSQNATALNAQINALRPRAGTSIFLGLKWGVTLLDPSFKPVLNALPSNTIDAVFSDRPGTYSTSTSTSSGDTQKYVVLMTDGVNDRSWRLYDWAYDTPSERAHWASENFPYYRATDLGWDSWNNWLYEHYNATIGDTHMAAMCTEAKSAERNIILYTISLGSSGDATTDEHGWTQLRNCASSPNHFFKTSGQELVEIFEDIADQITDLRLTL